MNKYRAAIDKASIELEINKLKLDLFNKLTIEPINMTEEKAYRFIDNQYKPDSTFTNSQKEMIQGFYNLINYQENKCYHTMQTL